MLNPNIQFDIFSTKRVFKTKNLVEIVTKKFVFRVEQNMKMQVPKEKIKSLFNKK